MTHPLQKFSRSLEGMPEGNMSRRRVLGMGAAAVPLVGLALSRSSAAAMQTLDKPVRLGLIADLHQDVMHDGTARMQAFAKAMNGQQLDAIMQLGDFAYPAKKNREVIELFNKAHKKPLHVIGNHDTDAGHTKQQCIDIWGMSHRFYVDHLGGVQLIVLDGNDSGSPTYKGGYPSFIGPEQLEWLEQQLADLAGPIIVFSHQPLAGPSSIDNAEQVQALLTKAADKILLAVNGHTHIDAVREVGGVRYWHVNSASYYWVGGKFRHPSYPADIHEANPWIDCTCPYRDPLFTTMTIQRDLSITVEAKTSEWVGPTPTAIGVDKRPAIDQSKEIIPSITARNWRR